MDPTCHDGLCGKCWGAKFIVVGIVLLVTAVNWPNYIWPVIGVLLILKGIMKLAMPMCSHCHPETKKRK